MPQDGRETGTGGIRTHGACLHNWFQASLLITAWIPFRVPPRGSGGSIKAPAHQGTGASFCFRPVIPGRSLIPGTFRMGINTRRPGSAPGLPCTCVSARSASSFRLLSSPDIRILPYRGPAVIQPVVYNYGSLLSVLNKPASCSLSMIPTTVSQVSSNSIPFA